MQLLLTCVTGACPCCGRPILFGERTHDTVDGVVCDECRRKLYTTCADCGNAVFFEYTTEIDGERICDDCRDENYEECAHCGDWCRRDDMIYADCEDARVCESCLDAYYVRCDHCDEIVREGDSYETDSGESICEGCYEDHYFTCDSCDRIFHQDDEYYDEERDRCLCPSCFEENQQQNGIYGYHDFPKSRYYPRFSSYDDANERTRGLLFGVELESDCGDFDADGFREWTDDSELVHFEHDGSLSLNGVECITQPCSLRFHQNEMKWPELCGALVSQGFKSHATGCCGLHVHIGRKNLPPSVITKMDVFINNASRFFSAIARRDVFYSSQYVPGKKLSKRKCERYGTHDERYQAVNTTNCQTVEIRIFRGTLKPETVVGTVEMLHALVGFLEYVPMKDIGRTEDNVRAFIRWCGERTDRYPHVLDLFERLLKRSGDCADYLMTLNVVQNENLKKTKRREMKKCA